MTKPDNPLAAAGTTLIFAVALVVEGSLFVVAMILGALFDAPPMATWAGVDAVAFAWGIAASLPPALAIMWALHQRASFAWRLLEQAQESVGALLRLSPWQLAIVAMLAGLTEEALFRGVLQIAATDTLTAWLDGAMAQIYGIGAGALLFGLAHPISRAYVVFAVLFGSWMGVLLLLAGNLLAPIVAHAVYDFILLLYIRWAWADRPAARHSELCVAE